MISLRTIKEEEKAIFKNLLTLYLHELSAYTDDLKINEEGLFEYDAFDLFFEDDKLHPYFILKNDEYIGFVLLSETPYTKPKTQYCIQEFFLLRYERHKGYGKKAIKELLGLHPGIYSLFIIKTNTQALRFWHAFYDYMDFVYEEGTETHEQYPNSFYQIFKTNQNYIVEK